MSNQEQFGGSENMVIAEDVTRLVRFLEEKKITDTADTDVIMEKAQEYFGEGYTLETIRAIVQEMYRREQEAAFLADLK